VLAVAEGTSKDCQPSTAAPDETNEPTNIFDIYGSMLVAGLKQRS